MGSEFNIVESDYFSQAESFSRKDLIKALELELSIQSNGKLVPSFQDVKQFTFQALDKTSGHVPYGPLLVTKFPELALLLASIGVMKAFSDYADYSSNVDSMFHALRILMYATPDQISQIDLLVVGGLYRFTNEKIIQPFETRLSALEKLIEIDPNQKIVILDRIEIYKKGLFEVAQLEELLRERVQILEAERNAEKFKIEEEKNKAKEINNTEINRLELSFKAGLISQSDYSAGKLKLSLENASNSISGSAKKSLLSLKNTFDNDKLVSYSNLFFGEIYDPYKRKRTYSPDSKLNKIEFIWLASIALGILLFAVFSANFLRSIHFPAV